MLLVSRDREPLEWWNQRSNRISRMNIEGAQTANTESLTGACDDDAVSSSEIEDDEDELNDRPTGASNSAPPALPPILSTPSASSMGSNSTGKRQPDTPQPSKSLKRNASAGTIASSSSNNKAPRHSGAVSASM